LSKVGSRRSGLACRLVARGRRRHERAFYSTVMVHNFWAEPELAKMVLHAVGLERVSAHDVLHRFFGWHAYDQQTPPQPIPNDYSNQGIMDKVTLMTATDVQLTDEQIRVLQTRNHPD